MGRVCPPCQRRVRLTEIKRASGTLLTLQQIFRRVPPGAFWEWVDAHHPLPLRGVVWLIFFRWRLVGWGWASGTVTVLIGALILAVFLTLFNYLTPTGSLTVVSRVVEATPNVSGEIVSIPVKTNVPIKAGDILFQINPAPLEIKVRKLAAALAQSRQEAKQLVSNYEEASANVEGLTPQLAYNRQRLSDIQNLTREEAQSVFKMPDTQVQYETVNYQLQAAKAAQITAKLAMDSEIGGVNTTVAHTEAELDHAKWELEQTTVRALDNGYVTGTCTHGRRPRAASSIRHVFHRFLRHYAHWNVRAQRV